MLPIMLLGFAPWMFGLMHGFNLIYQFWIHTKFIDRLGWMEYVLTLRHITASTMALTNNTSTKITPVP